MSADAQIPALFHCCFPIPVDAMPRHVCTAPHLGVRMIYKAREKCRYFSSFQLQVNAGERMLNYLCQPPKSLYERVWLQISVSKLPTSMAPNAPGAGRTWGHGTAHPPQGVLPCCLPHQILSPSPSLTATSHPHTLSLVLPHGAWRYTGAKCHLPDNAIYWTR